MDKIASVELVLRPRHNFRLAEAILEGAEEGGASVLKVRERRVTKAQPKIARPRS